MELSLHNFHLTKNRKNPSNGNGQTHWNNMQGFV